MKTDRCISMTPCCVALLMVCSGGSVRASCAYTLQGEGRVSAVLDARTFRLDDGRAVRLAGIELPEEATRARSALTSLIGGREVALHGPDERPDRFGRQPAFVFTKGSGISIQSELLARGEAWSSGTIADKGCSTALLACESAARTARHGIWGSSAALKNAERPGDILAGKGRFAVVEGTISSARPAGAAFYINFGRRWTRDFAVTISRRMMPSFGTAGIDLKSLKDKEFELAAGSRRVAAPGSGRRTPGRSS